MKVGVLTSSRADFGIYRPLLRALIADPFFEVGLIVFGTHLSPYHGNTIDEIVREGFPIDYRVPGLLLSDDAESIATSMAITGQKFSKIWLDVTYDIVLALGDRFEMFAAVSASAPFNIPIAHIHAGEISIGAIDNQFRDAISIFSRLFFVSTEPYKDRVKRLIGEEAEVYNVGALSLDNLDSIKLFDVTQFHDRFGIDMRKKSILITVHPETKQAADTAHHISQLLGALLELSDYQLIITMPNADTNGSIIRKAFEGLNAEVDNVHIIENFGTLGYFSCMKLCNLLIGNTSSGILEAGSFHKYVINLGDRQKGRLAGDNVYHVSYDKDAIVTMVRTIEGKPQYAKQNIYWNGGATAKILKVLKKS